MPVEGGDEISGPLTSRPCLESFCKGRTRTNVNTAKTTAGTRSGEPRSPHSIGRPDSVLVRRRQFLLVTVRTENRLPVRPRARRAGAPPADLIQSILWVILSSLAIATHLCQLPTENYEKKGSSLTTLIWLYFEGEECKVDIVNLPSVKDSATKPSVVHSWMISYLFASSLQVVLSGYLFYRRHDCEKKLKVILKGWCFVSLVIAAMDISLCGIFISDYIKVKEVLESLRVGVLDTDVQFIPLAMFVVSARGFALWLINIIQVIYLALWAFCGGRSETTVPVKLSQAVEKPQANYLRGYDNYNYMGSAEEFDQRWKAAKDSGHQVPKQGRSNSVLSLEAVTPFNVVDDSAIPIPGPHLKKYHEAKDRSSNLYNCTCHLKPGESNCGAENFHSHGCSVLQSELQNKLQTMRSKKDRTDFSHDIKNFKQGGKHNKSPIRGPPKIANDISPPAATTASNLHFY